LDVVQSAVITDGSQRTELEQRIVYHALRNRPNRVPQDATVRIVAAGDDSVSLAELLELAATLRDAVGRARAVTPADVTLPGRGDQAAAVGAEVQARAAAALTALQAVDTALTAAPAAGAAALRTALLRASLFGVPGTVPLT